jgi:hypothetical protein
MIEVLGFATLLGYLQAVIANIADPRRSSPNTQYSVKDAVLSANVVFFMQCESFLEYQANGEVQYCQQRQRHGRDWYFYTYRWLNVIPLRDTQPALETNWFELTVTRASDGEVIYQNAWITDHLITIDNIVEIVQSE